MKKLLISVAVAGLFAGAPAFAQDNDHHDQNGPNGGQHQAQQEHKPAQQLRRDAVTEKKDNAAVRHDNAAVHHDNAVIQNQQHTINQQHRDFSAFRRTVTAQRKFHAAAYRRPPGWYDHRWNPGERLQPAFFAQDYWITDFNDYALQPPPDGAVWVRYGNDALLIDQYSGEVIQVAMACFIKD